MFNSPAIEEAIRTTVPGSKWYYKYGREVLHEVTVESVTETTVTFTNGEELSKEDREAQGATWFPPTSEIVELYGAQTLYLESLRKLQGVACWATSNYLRTLTTQMETILSSM
jgi:hypothetical protein